MRALSSSGSSKKVTSASMESQACSEWLAELLAAHGIQVLPEQLRTVPYTVELSSRLAQRLQASTARSCCD